MEPFVGTKAELILYQDFTIDLETSIGGYSWTGDEKSASVDIRVGFQYRPHKNVGAQIGYRMLAFNLSQGSGDSEFGWQGAMAGLYAGLVLRF